MRCKDERVTSICMNYIFWKKDNKYFLFEATFRAVCEKSIQLSFVLFRDIVKESF